MPCCVTLSWERVRWHRRCVPPGALNTALFATVARLDGAFGLRGLPLDHEPIAGGLAGLVKTAGHEWPEVACKAIDLASDVLPAKAAERLCDELLRVGPSEVGLTVSGHWALQRQVEPQALLGRAVPLQAGDVVVISGGARGVTAAVAEVLARAYQPTLVLLGRTPLRDEAAGLSGLTSETEIKRELSRRQPTASLRDIGEQYQGLSAVRAIRATLAAIERCGARAVYRNVDVRDAAATAEVLARIRQELGPVRGIIHAAGVLADARIEDKTGEQFDLVYGTKVDGSALLIGGGGRRRGSHPGAVLLDDGPAGDVSARRIMPWPTRS